MRRSILAGLLVLVVAGNVTLMAPSAGAMPPEHVTIPFGFTFQDPGLTQACGFAVFVSLSGAMEVKLFFDETGTLVREIDTGPNVMATTSAPSTGKSFSYPFIDLGNTTYSGGGALGTEAVISESGLLFRVDPGNVMNARHIVEEGVVIDHFGDVPIVEPTQVLSQNGNVFMGDLTAAICVALTG